MHDILPKDQKYWERIRVLSRAIFSYYNFSRIDTPHLEDSELFLQAVGFQTDIVEKQTYSLKTEGGDELTLRPEGTASTVRAYLQNGFVAEPHPVKFYYQGAFFRHESPQRGRYRELNQLGLEVIGDQNPVADAEVIHVFSVLLRELGIREFFFHVNSVGCKDCRPSYRSHLIQYYRPKAKGLCRDCKKRLKQNPLRLLDCKEEKCRILKKGTPQILDHICEACKKHFTLMLEFLDENEIPYILNPYLVRGLDYYTKTVFEIFTDSDWVGELEDVKDEEKKEPPLEISANDAAGGTENPAAVVEARPEEKKILKGIAIGAGGRYDDLVSLLGGRSEPAVGGTLGLERLVMLMKAVGVKLPEEPRMRVFFVQLGDFAKKKSFKIIEELRRAGIPLGESLGRDSVKSQLKIADKSGSDYSLILGQKEAIDSTIIIREMSSGIQEVIPQEMLVETLRKKLKR